MLLPSVCLISCETRQISPAKNNTAVADPPAFRKMLDDVEQESLHAAEFDKEKKSGAFYEAASPYHNLVHAYTYLVAMRDYCNKSLRQPTSPIKMDKQLQGKLEWELFNAKSKLLLPTFAGLKIEEGLYDKYLKQLDVRFRDGC